VFIDGYPFFLSQYMLGIGPPVMIISFSSSFVMSCTTLALQSVCFCNQNNEQVVSMYLEISKCT